MASGEGVVHVFLRDVNGAVVHNRHVHGTGWVGWTNLGGAVVGNLAAASPALKNVWVFARTTDNRLIRKTWDGTGFSASWTNDDGIANMDSAPTAISNRPRPGRRSLHRSPYATYRRRHFDGTSWISEDVGSVGFGLATSIPIVASSWADNTLDIFLELVNGTILVRSRR